MTMKEINVNCISFLHGSCTHQAAPRRIFGPAVCIIASPPADLRLAGCTLCTPYPKPPPPIREPVQRPDPPPSQIRRENKIPNRRA